MGMMSGGATFAFVNSEKRMKRFLWLFLGMMVCGCSTPEKIFSLESPFVLGYQLDISRGKVPQMATLFRIVDILNKLGYNQFQLYTEHTFAYSRHEAVWCEASPMMPDEVRKLDAYCRDRGIELVANQNSFGHLEQWLRHPGYNDLAECPMGGATVTKWNYTLKFPMCLNPTDPRSLEFLAGLYDELLPCFSSRLVNIGGDETMELLDDHVPRTGRSAAELAQKGPPRVYLDFLLKIDELLKDRGHRMMFWGDIVLHYPELIKELPEDAICLNWGYEAGHPFERQAAQFKAARRQFYVCPGTSAWGSLSGRVTNMMGNVDGAMKAAERHGASGLLLADWGDGGNPQPWLVSIPALVYTAHRVRGQTLTRAELAKKIDDLLGGKCGAALLDYGDLYLKTKGPPHRAEAYRILRDGCDYARPEGVTDQTMMSMFVMWKTLRTGRDLTGAPEWVKDDFALIDLLYEAVKVKIDDPKCKNFRAMFEPEYRRLWLKQNRIGGLRDSLVSVFGPQ